MVTKLVTIEMTKDVTVPKMKGVIEDRTIFGTEMVVVPKKEGVAIGLTKGVMVPGMKKVTEPKTFRMIEDVTMPRTEGLTKLVIV
ncbi:Hypothetical predicted protein [Olea europaea subsp. europaea]|uniref:Uncharacterized protein n=1 Tax=Olea europaea subsp. europaea TaxID=158383 RepID=A0A8S0Q2P1_OLEEU|nr:Hypothetical predicted protein [Olea europaea subsp. europaea]